MSYTSSYISPTLLTVMRLIVSPTLFPFLITTYLPAQDLMTRLSIALVFGALAVTDFFDGYIARKWKQESLLGSILDPLADKILVLAALVSLMYIQRVAWPIVIIVLGREFFVMGLREFALSQGITISVALPGKIKTVFQFLYIMTVLLNAQTRYEYDFYFFSFEHFMLVGMLFFTIYSASVYYTFCVGRLFPS